MTLPNTDPNIYDALAILDSIGKDYLDKPWDAEQYAEQFVTVHTEEDIANGAPRKSFKIPGIECFVFEEQERYIYHGINRERTPEEMKHVNENRARLEQIDKN